MARTKIPSYLHHKATGQAFVRLNGKQIYLGLHGTPRSKDRYDEVIADWIKNGRTTPPEKRKPPTCEALAVRFIDWAKEYYVKDDKPTATFDHCNRAVATFVRFYGQIRVEKFAPGCLKRLQRKFIKHGYARQTVNRYVSIIRQMIKQGVADGDVSPTVLTAIQAVDNLKAGRTKAKEYRRILPVVKADVDKTLPFLPSIVADMVRLQYLAGMRPQEVRMMRACDIDRTGKVWKYRPRGHKTEHHCKILEKAIGPKAQAILIPYLITNVETPEAFLFSPADSAKLQRLQRWRENRTPIKKIAGALLRRNHNHSDFYTKNLYDRTICRACEQAGVKWTANQLRHLIGTEVREKFGLEAAQVFLGHSNAKTTEIDGECYGIRISAAVTVRKNKFIFPHL